MDPQKDIYRNRSVETPSLERLKRISSELGFDIPDKEMTDYLECLDEWLTECDLIDEIPEPTLPVNYPRTPGYRPSPEENTHNAWYYKTNIKGRDKGLLAGKRIAIKDNVAVSGVPMMNGSRLLEGYVPEVDATVITRILDAGGIITGKATCEDLCRGGSSFTTSYGPVLNPVDKTRDAGGSSSGCATLLGLGEVDMAIGGDQGGSIRIPASFCGIVGLKPTFGLVPYTGICSFDQWVDHVGPMAQTVKDCAVLLQAIAGYDNGFDPRQSSDIIVPSYLDELTGDVSGIKIGLLEEGFSWCDQKVQVTVREAIFKYLPSAKTENVSIPLHTKGPVIFGACTKKGVYDSLVSNPCVGSGGRGFHLTSLANHLFMALKAKPNDLSPTMKLTCLYGEYQKQNYGSKYYCKSMNLVRTLTDAYDKALSEFDVIVMPTTPTTAKELPQKDLSVKGFIKYALGNNRNTIQADATGHPALSLNAGYIDGLPVGVMIVGRRHEEATVLNVGLALENERDNVFNKNT